MGWTRQRSQPVDPPATHFVRAYAGPTALDRAVRIASAGLQTSPPLPRVVPVRLWTGKDIKHATRGVQRLYAHEHLRIHRRR